MDMNSSSHNHQGQQSALQLEDMLCHEKIVVAIRETPPPEVPASKPKKKNHNRRKREKIRERKSKDSSI